MSIVETDVYSQILDELGVLIRMSLEKHHSFAPAANYMGALADELILKIPNEEDRQFYIDTAITKTPATWYLKALVAELISRLPVDKQQFYIDAIHDQIGKV
jgi:hypothetical protein